MKVYGQRCKPTDRGGVEGAKVVSGSRTAGQDGDSLTVGCPGCASERGEMRQGRRHVRSTGLTGWGVVGSPSG